MNNFLTWIANNWFMIIIAIAAIVVVAFAIYGFIKTPRSQQIEKVRAWLLQACIAAEKELGSGTGQAKLSMTYDAFVKAFPAVSTFLSFTTFSKLVDEVLVKMRDMLSSNKSLQEYVYGESEPETETETAIVTEEISE